MSLHETRDLMEEDIDTHMEEVNEAIRAETMDEDFFSSALLRSQNFGQMSSREETPSLRTQSSAESVESLKEVCLQSKLQQQEGSGSGRCWAEAARTFEYPIPSPRVSKKCAEDVKDVYCGIPVGPRSLAAVGQRTERFLTVLERISGDSDLAHSNAVYISTTPRDELNSSAGEDTMISVWDPSPANLAASVLPGSGHTTNIISAACKAQKKSRRRRGEDKKVKARERVDHYKRYNDVFKVELPSPEELNDSGRSFTGCL